MAPFQCDTCWFRNLFKRSPVAMNEGDKFNLALIRRANLDMFWSREASTVQGLRGYLKDILEQCASYGQSVPLDPMEAWKVEDKQGMGVMICMLEKSLRKGRNADYTQFDSCRSLRSAVANVYAATAQASDLRYSLKNARGVMHLEEGNTQTVLMERAVAGMKARMPQVSKRNLPFTSKMINFILEHLEARWFDLEESEEGRRAALMSAAYLCVTYGYSLRGNEGFWVDADRLCRHIRVGKHDERCPHVIIPLLGRFKSEDGDRMHVIPIVNRTRSGIKVRLWLERLVSLLRSERRTNGPAFCDEEGYLLQASAVEEVIHPILIEMQSIPRYKDEIPSSLDVTSWYRVARSCRRGAENTALDQGISSEVVKFVHRWSKFERNKGRLPGFDMLEHYAAGNKTRYMQLQFSQCL